MANTKQHNQMANAIRFLAIDAIERAKSGHPGLPMGAADIATVLYTKFLAYDPKNPHWVNRDRFVLSAGHGSMLLYALMYLSGYEDMSLEDLRNFRKIGHKVAGHPEYGHASGIETTTGPLGQGLANAVGMALGERLQNARFGDLIDHYTYVLVGDGCLMEGIAQEAISFAGHFKLNKLIVLWDDNNISSDGAISLVDSTDQLARFKASGWNTIKIDGHSQIELEHAIKAARISERPTLIACETTIGFGSPNKSGTSGVHGAPLGAEEASETRKALGWEAEPFAVPPDILDSWRLAGLKASKKREEWDIKFASLPVDERVEFERLIRGDLVGGVDEAIAEYKKTLALDRPSVATRKASEMVLDVINGMVVETIGGSADLTSSNNTKSSQMESITADDFSGRYVHYGVREHAMAAIMNGLALYGGFIPYGGTFLCFSDYMRPAMRLSSLMGLRVIYVMTHDSIGLGEDGPTHQPVEHLAALRALPNHFVFRPADAVETAECWQLALKSRNTPSTLALSRQNLPFLRQEYQEDNLCSLGAYELLAASDDAQVTLFASGSEVQIIVEAHTVLEEKGIPTRVVSVPCFELFFQQSVVYQEALIGNAPIKIAVEAAIRQGWDSFIGNDGTFVGLNAFGASGAVDDLWTHFGITRDNIVSIVEEKLEKINGEGVQ